MHLAALFKYFKPNSNLSTPDCSPLMDATTTTMSDSFSVKISLLEGAGLHKTAPKVVTLQSSSTSTELLDLVCDNLGVPSSAKSSISITNASREKLDLGGKKTVSELGIKKQDRLIVAYTAPVEGRGRGAAKPPPTVAAKPPPVAVAGSSKQSRRSAALDARDRIVEVQKVHTKMARKESQKKNQQRKKNKNKSTTGSKRKSNKKIKIEGGGHQLSSGEYVPGAGGEKTKLPPCGNLMEGIVYALTGGMKEEVSKLHIENRANACVAAVDIGNYTIQIAKGGDNVETTGILLGKANDFRKEVGVSNGGSAGVGAAVCTSYKLGDNNFAHRRITDTPIVKRATVTYSKGIEGSGSHTEDDIEILPIEVVTRVLRDAYKEGVAATENAKNAPVGSRKDHRLTPALIAQVSRRVFWSLVHHCNGPGKSVADMLQELLPTLDWSYLNRNGRMTFMSEKAEQNWDQQQCKKSVQDLHKDEVSLGTRLDNRGAYNEVTGFLHTSYIALETAIEHQLYGGNDRDKELHNALKMLQLLTPKSEKASVNEGLYGEDDDEAEEAVEKENPLAHRCICRCRTYLDRCEKVLESNQLVGTYLDMLVKLVAGIRCSLVQDFDGVEGDELLETFRGLNLPKSAMSSMACFMGARRVASFLVEETFGHGAMLIASLSSVLAAREVDRASVEKDDKTMLENKKALFSDYWMGARYWLQESLSQNKDHIVEGELDGQSGEKETLYVIQRALGHLILLKGDVKKCETMALINNEDKKAVKKGEDGTKCDISKLATRLPSLLEKEEGV